MQNEIDKEIIESLVKVYVGSMWSKLDKEAVDTFSGIIDEL